MDGRWTTLVRPDELEAALGDRDVVAVDCRFSLADPRAGEAAYRQSHIPGARHAHLDRDLSGPHAPGAGRHPWPDARGFTAWLRRQGISPRTRVVAYDDGDGAFAARLWFLLRVLGHASVAVLDGGWDRWRAEGRPQDATVPAEARADYDACFDATLLCDAAGVQAHLDAGGLLLDARAPERYRGDVEPLDPVAGHIPGAVNRFFKDNLGPDGSFKPAAQLRAEFEALLEGRPAGQVIHQCGSGVTACHNLLAMELAGLSGASLYPGSWSEWCSDPRRPVARG